MLLFFCLYNTVPTRPPSDLQILGLTALSASVTWKAPPKSSLNGKFIKYSVTLKESDGSNLKVHDTMKDKIEFHNIKPFTKYLVQVAAYNSVGCGPTSQDLFFTTPEAGIS